jgi:hypothetical protein
MSAAVPTPRLTVSEVARRLLDNAGGGSDSSVTITRNAKGVAQFEVVVRNADPAEAQRIATEVYNDLVFRYPHPDNGKPTAAS